MLVAADTNVLLDLALGTKVVTDALETLRERIPKEMNDSLIVAEAALLGCGILLSTDGHMRGIDFQRLNLLLQDFHVASPIIATPREIVKKFCR